MKNIALRFSAVFSAAVAAAGVAFGALAPDEIAIGEPTGTSIKPLNGVGAGPKTGWGLGKDGGVYIDATGSAALELDPYEMILLNTAGELK